MTPISLDQFAASFAARLPQGGAFLTASGKGVTNAMTIGWGSAGIYWGMPVVVVPVRHSRYTLPLIQESGLFTVSVPLHDMKSALTYCGTKSGRDGDKFGPAGITAVSGQTPGTFVVAEADVFAECRVRYVMDMEKQPLPEDIGSRWYSGSHMHMEGDVHMMIYGEAVALWRKDG